MAMIRNSAFARLGVFPLIFSAAFSHAIRAQEASVNRINWQPAPGEHYLETAFSQKWNLPAGSRIDKFQFSAIRFHLGYFQLKLLGIADFAKRNPKEIAQSQKVDPSLDSLLDLGLNAIYRAKPFENILALVSAGFPASERKPINLGLLKTDGVTLSQILEDGPSAILCLDSPKYQGQGYKFQLPVFYKTDDDRQQDLIRQCRDAVQVGPRILEDPNAVTKDSASQISYRRVKKGVPDRVPVYLGISAKLMFSRAAYFRTFIALDEPGRDDIDGKSRNVARNAYIVVTETPVTLWELQSMLCSPGFYANEAYAPYWAVNLVGGDFTGMIVKLAGNEDVNKFGNTDITQASVLAVTRR